MSGYTRFEDKSSACRASNDKNQSVTTNPGRQETNHVSGDSRQPAKRRWNAHRRNWQCNFSSAYALNISSVVNRKSNRCSSMRLDLFHCIWITFCAKNWLVFNWTILIEVYKEKLSRSRQEIMFSEKSPSRMRGEFSRVNLLKHLRHIRATTLLHANYNSMHVPTSNKLVNRKLHAHIEGFSSSRLENYEI